jgi:hypothetical protein
MHRILVWDVIDDCEIGSYDGVMENSTAGHGAMTVLLPAGSNRWVTMLREHSMGLKD